MTRQETGKFLDELATLYPMIKRDTDMALMGDLWEEALKDYSYKDVHAALQDYFRSDTKGYVPTAGQLIECIDDKVDYLHPEGSIFLGW